MNFLFKIFYRFFPKKKESIFFISEGKYCLHNGFYRVLEGKHKGKIIFYNNHLSFPTDDPYDRMRVFVEPGIGGWHIPKKELDDIKLEWIRPEFPSIGIEAKKIIESKKITSEERKVLERRALFKKEMDDGINELHRFIYG